MFKTIVFSAFGAALLVGVSVSIVQSVTTEPLILHAEKFEDAGPAPAHDHAAPAMASESAAAHEQEEAWAPAEGFERIFFTVMANLVTAFSVSLVLVGLMFLKGDPIDARRGLLWGLGGFAAASLLPALGLPPELPGTPAADIFVRQAWWIATIAASAAGIGLLVFGRRWAVWVVGVVLLIAPHLIGAPPPPSHEVTYPGALAGEFVIASLIVSAVLWLLSGLASGWLYQRFARTA
jgi:cobalt transporter subunit CbtA